MEAATEVSIAYSLKASSVFSQEYVGGPKNGSSKSACRATRLGYKQECTEHAFTGVKSKSAWRAVRLQSSCTGVHSRTRHRSAMALTIYYCILGIWASEHPYNVPAKLYLPVRTLVCAVWGTYLGVCQQFCEQIMWSDFVSRLCLLKLFKYFYQAVCKTNTGTHVGD
jgi:hypothetical protein